MKKVAETIKKYRLFVLILSVFSLFYFFVATLFMDNRWWLLSLILIPLTVLLLYVYNDKVNHQTIIGYNVQYISGLLILASLLFVLMCSIFITPWWWFGLVIPLSFLAVWGYFSQYNEVYQIDSKDKKIALYSVIGVLVTFFCLFFIPSLFANNQSNPQESFGSGYSAVASYSIYNDYGELDREHIFAQSWYQHSNHYINDRINVIWSNKQANSQRGSFIFNNVLKSSATEIKDGNVIVGYKNNSYFMPLDEYKGDVARIMLYMYVTYKDDGLPLEYINVNLMKDWSHQDPVDQRERERNNAIKQMHGYGNIFVEIPWLVGFVV